MLWSVFTVQPIPTRFSPLGANPEYRSRSEAIGPDRQRMRTDDPFHILVCVKELIPPSAPLSVHPSVTMSRVVSHFDRHYLLMLWNSLGPFSVRITRLWRSVNMLRKKWAVSIGCSLLIGSIDFSELVVLGGETRGNDCRCKGCTKCKRYRLLSVTGLDPDQY